jgi:hypothetical protein
MRFRTSVTSGGEVAFAGERYSGPTYYGGPPESGLWHISMPKFEDYVAAELEPFAFGESIEAFDFGFEIGELNEWGEWFKATRNYVSYRPKSKLLIAVGQLEWRVVKDLPATEQLAHLSSALMTAIEHIGDLKRKPKHFDRLAFAEITREVLSKCKTAMVVADATAA